METHPANHQKGQTVQMSDTQAPAPEAESSLTAKYEVELEEAPSDFPTMYAILTRQLRDIDQDLDISQDPKAFSKKAIRDRLISENKDDVEKNVTSFSQALQSIPDMNTRVGTYFGIMEGLALAFETQFETYLDSQLEGDSAFKEKSLSTEDQTELTKYRAGVYKNADMLRDMILQMAPTHMKAKLEEQYPEPKKRTGKSGPRGPRAISNFEWLINGKKVEGLDNLTVIANAYGYDGPATIRKELQEKLGRNDLKEPPALPDTMTLLLKLKDGQTEPDTLMGRKIQPQGEPLDDSPAEGSDDETPEPNTEQTTEQ